MVLFRKSLHRKLWHRCPISIGEGLFIRSRLVWRCFYLFVMLGCVFFFVIAVQFLKLSFRHTIFLFWGNTRKERELKAKQGFKIIKQWLESCKLSLNLLKQGILLSPHWMWADLTLVAKHVNEKIPKLQILNHCRIFHLNTEIYVFVSCFVFFFIFYN